jgi:uncharacterized protein
VTTGRGDRPQLNWVLKVLVGSRAHGLHTDTSDYDYRGVFVQPTEDILKLGGTVQQTSWIEDRDPTQAGHKEDDTGWEIGHFLKLALQCNPTILEVFAAPKATGQNDPWLGTTEEGEALRALFPAVWHPQRVRDAFVGYGLNQRKKMLEDKDARWHKYATAYLRTLCQAEQLLTQGVLRVDFRTHEEYQTLLMFRNRMVSPGAVIDKCAEWQYRVEDAAAGCIHKPDEAAVNDFLLAIRRAHWA